MQFRFSGRTTSREKWEWECKKEKRFSNIYIFFSCYYTVQLFLDPSPIINFFFSSSYSFAFWFHSYSFKLHSKRLPSIHLYTVNPYHSATTTTTEMVYISIIFLCSFNFSIYIVRICEVFSFGFFFCIFSQSLVLPSVFVARVIKESANNRWKEKKENVESEEEEKKECDKTIHKNKINEHVFFVRFDSFFFLFCFYSSFRWTSTISCSTDFLTWSTRRLWCFTNYFLLLLLS